MFKKKSNSIFNKKQSDLTVGEQLKVGFWGTIIAMILGCLPWLVITICEMAEDRKKEKALRNEPPTIDEEEETSD